MVSIRIFPRIIPPVVAKGYMKRKHPFALEFLIDISAKFLSIYTQIPHCLGLSNFRYKTKTNPV